MHLIARTIKQQIGFGALASLGAWSFRDDCNGRALVFDALILPFRKDGTRGTKARKMDVSIILEADDTYSVGVADKRTFAEHFRRDGVYAHELPRLMLALDYDGDTVLNPRYAA